MSKQIDAQFVRDAAQAVEPDETVVRQVVAYMRPKTYRQEEHRWCPECGRPCEHLGTARDIAATLYDFGVQVRDQAGL